MPRWFSSMTVPNHRKNRLASSSAPGTKTHAPAQSLRKLTAPSITVNRVTEPMIGHGLWCGM
jgi:hypothetical protein